MNVPLLLNLIIDPMLGIGNNTCVLNALHCGLDKSSSNDGIFSREILEIATSIRNPFINTLAAGKSCRRKLPSNSNSWSELNICTLHLKLFGHCGTPAVN